MDAVHCMDRFLHDVCHSQLLGTGKVLNGSVLTFLAESGYFCPWAAGRYDTVMENTLRRAYIHWDNWKKAKNLAVNQPRFTCARLNRRSRISYPSLSSKAIASKALTFWLSDCALEFSKQNESSNLAKEVATCAWSYAEILRMLDEARPFNKKLFVFHTTCNYVFSCLKLI